jgi:hypothetical protein
MFFVYHDKPHTERVGVTVTRMSSVQEVFNSTLGRDTGYPDWDFSLLSVLFPGKCLDGTSIKPVLLHSTFFPVHHSFIISPFDIM